MTATSVESIFTEMWVSLGGEGQPSQTTVYALSAAVAALIMSLDLSQLVFLFIGAGTYAAMQSLQPVHRRPSTKAAAHKSRKLSVDGDDQVNAANYKIQPSTEACSVDDSADCGGAKKSPPPWRPKQQRTLPIAPPSSMAVNKTPSSTLQIPKAPLPMVNLPSCGWRADVEFLLEAIVPTLESDQVVERLASCVKRTLRRTIPEVEVIGFAGGNLARGQAFGVAVPDVDLVINVNPDVLSARLQGRQSQAKQTSGPELDAHKLQKSAIRVFTDCLVSSGGFKFRRSAFRDSEPKVTLLAPASIGVSEQAIPVGISINAVTPLYYAALLTECGRLDPRARELTLLVKRWAKDRAICHAAKGHLSPYLWGLLAIYFLQVGSEEGPILPPLKDFEVSSSLVAGAAPHEGKAMTPRAERPSRSCDPGKRKTTASLFKEFFHFYNNAFEWDTEAVGVRLGRRAPPDAALSQHVLVDPDGRSTVGLTVEDPFAGSKTTNLASCLTAASLERLHFELGRADSMCKAGGSLSLLLEPWIPKENENQEPTKESE